MFQLLKGNLQITNGSPASTILLKTHTSTGRFHVQTMTFQHVPTTPVAQSLVLHRDLGHSLSLWHSQGLVPEWRSSIKNGWLNQNAFPGQLLGFKWLIYPLSSASPPVLNNGTVSCQVTVILQQYLVHVFNVNQWLSSIGSVWVQPKFWPIRKGNHQEKRADQVLRSFRLSSGALWHSACCKGGRIQPWSRVALRITTCSKSMLRKSRLGPNIS